MILSDDYRKVVLNLLRQVHSAAIAGKQARSFTKDVIVHDMNFLLNTENNGMVNHLSCPQSAWIITLSIEGTLLNLSLNGDENACIRDLISLKMVFDV